MVLRAEGGAQAAAAVAALADTKSAGKAVELDFGWFFMGNFFLCLLGVRRRVGAPIFGAYGTFCYGISGNVITQAAAAVAALMTQVRLGRQKYALSSLSDWRYRSAKKESHAHR